MNEFKVGDKVKYSGRNMYVTKAFYNNTYYCKHVDNHLFYDGTYYCLGSELKPLVSSKRVKL